MCKSGVMVRKSILRAAAAAVVLVLTIPYVVVANLSLSLATREDIIDLSSYGEEASDTIHALDVGDGPTGALLESSSLILNRSVADATHLQKVDGTFRFLPNLLPGQDVRVAMRNATGHNMWTTIYDPLLQDLSEAHSGAENGSLRLFDLRPSGEGVNQSWFEQPPPYAITTTRGFTFEPTSPTLSELGPRGLPGTKMPTFPKPGNSTKIPIGLRSDLSIFVFVEGGSKPVVLSVRDLNRVTGSDEFRLSLKSLDGAELDHWDIPDDGNMGTKRTETLRNFTVSLSVDRPGWYVVQTKGVSADIGFEDVRISTPALHSRRITLGGPTWDTHMDGATSLTLFTHGGKLSLSYSRNQDYGTTKVYRDDGSIVNVTVDPDSPFKKSYVTLAAGTYRITSTAGAVQVSITEGYLTFEPRIKDLPRERTVEETSSGLTIRNALRGNVRMWTYVADGKVDLRILKQDLNWYAGPDETTLVLTDVAGNERGRIRMNDDGIIANSSALGAVQSGHLHANDLPSGSYLIRMEGSGDYVIRETSISEEKLVFENPQLIGFNSCCYKSLDFENDVDLFFGSVRPGYLDLSTSHKSGYQDISMEGLVHPFSGEVRVNETGKLYRTDHVRGQVLRILLPEQDIQFRSTTGYFGFSSKSFFFPIRNPTAEFKPDLEYLEGVADIVVVDYGAYSPLAPASEEGMYVWNRVWASDNIGLVNGELRLAIQVTNMHDETFPNSTLYLEPIVLRYGYVPMWDRSPVMRFIYGWAH